MCALEKDFSYQLHCWEKCLLVDFNVHIDLSNSWPLTYLVCYRWKNRLICSVMEKKTQNFRILWKESWNESDHKAEAMLFPYRQVKSINKYFRPVVIWQGNKFIFLGNTANRKWCTNLFTSWWRMKQKN